MSGPKARRSSTGPDDFGAASTLQGPSLATSSTLQGPRQVHTGEYQHILVFRNGGILVFRIGGIMVFRNGGIMFFRNDGILVFRNDGILVFRNDRIGKTTFLS